MHPTQDRIRAVAIYCRVSSDQQREKRTIDSQVSTLTAYAERYNYHVYRIYQDDGFSGSTIVGRPAFQELLIDCTCRKFDAILVVEHNRITRSENPEEVGKIQRILMENNIRIISPPEGVLDLKRPPDELVAWIKMWIAKEERREILSYGRVLILKDLQIQLFRIWPTVPKIVPENEIRASGNALDRKLYG